MLEYVLGPRWDGGADSSACPTPRRFRPGGTKWSFGSPECVGEGDEAQSCPRLDFVSPQARRLCYEKNSPRSLRTNVFAAASGSGSSELTAVATTTKKRAARRGATPLPGPTLTIAASATSLLLLYGPPPSRSGPTACPPHPPGANYPCPGRSRLPGGRLAEGQLLEPPARSCQRVQTASANASGDWIYLSQSQQCRHRVHLHHLPRAAAEARSSWKGKPPAFPTQPHTTDPHSR